MNKKSINIADPTFTKKDRTIIHAEIDKILSGKLSMGNNVKAFEKEFSEYSNSKYAIATNSCTSALEIALKGLGISSGDEVIVPCQTFIATGMAVHLVGGKPIFCEVNEKDFCIDIEHLKSLITSKTKGVILVHFAGLISDDIFKIKELCDEYNIFLIEDAAHAPGASINKKKSGTIGIAGCFSFFPSKVITAGEGGMLITDNEKLADFSRSQQHRGRDNHSKKEQYILPGRNVRMTEMTAITGRVQFSHLDEFLSKRRMIADKYKKAFRENDRIKVIAPDDNLCSSYWKFPILLSSNINRNALLNHLIDKGINADTTYDPLLHLQPIFKNEFNITENHLPNSEGLMKRHLCLPCHQNISIHECEYIIDSIMELIT